MDHINQDTLSIEVDGEHIGIRSAFFAAMVLGAVVGYMVGAALFSNGSFSILAVIGAGVGIFAFSNITERLLVGRWKSGRVVVVNKSGVQLVSKGQAQKSIESSNVASVLNWRFEIQKRARVPQGWYMIACALEQNDNYLTVYTFISPKQFEDLEDHHRYTVLLSKKDKSTAHDLRLAGQQRRLHMAESYRWAEGAEMKLEDFIAFMSRIRSQFPTWIY